MPNLQDDPMRPLLNVSWPSWDGKLVLAGIFIIGYYTLVTLMVLGTGELATTKSGIIRDAMLTLSAPIGVIIGALFRTTGAEERREALRSGELRTAIEAPTALAAAPPAELAESVENGARAGTRAGVREAIADAPDEPATYEGPDLPAGAAREPSW